MTDPKKFLLNSDYPLDKIVYMTSGTFVSNAVGGGSVTIPHGLGFMPLPYIQWSLNSDFSTCQEITERPGDLYPTVFPYIVSYESNATNIIINFFNGALAQTTYYYRIICFMPTDINADVTNIASLADDFILNTDYNYTKLFMSGINTSTTVTHNLGYVPQVMWWYESSADKILSPVNLGYPTTNTPYVTTTTVVFPNTNYHYRIYIDE
jgi:hypothetical protein